MRARPPAGTKRWRPVGAAAGGMLDLILGEPPDQVHPLRAFGALMTRLESFLYRRSRLAGSLYAAAGVAAGVLAGRSIGSTALASYVAIGGQSLAGAAQAVEHALDVGDLDAARQAARWLVGRDVAGLDETELSRAAVESVAENTVDAVVAPLLYSALWGACGALGYRAVNTLDAMVGYRNERYQQFGWASARLDDLANLVPARATALLIMLLQPKTAGTIWRTVRRDAPGHPSPNAGVAESAFAAALGVRLGGANSYGGKVELRALMGDGRPPRPADVGRAVALSRRVGIAAAVISAGVGVARALRRPFFIMEQA
ncbi:MAG TPA: adenosylcobinamide-phosphate synthase CbiB [Acidimicrobiales bacterium]|nr:adenosylcobinamide-phosphate synthase CbiB [Acidimicrobiales bacterium]